MEFKQIIQFYVELFMICSPFVAVPSFISLTKGRSVKEKKRTGMNSSIGVAIILLIAAWVGSSFLAFVGIRIAAFQVAGGFVIFLLALSMLHAQTSRMKSTPEEVEEVRSSIAIVPLAIPLMAGPGAISSVIVASMEFPGILNHGLISLVSIAVAFSLWICLRFAFFLEKILGPIGLNIVSRLAGLLLSALAVEIMARGLSGLFPELCH